MRRSWLALIAAALLLTAWVAHAQIPFGSAVGAGVSSLVAGSGITVTGSPNVTVAVDAPLTGALGGTGVANTAKTITLGGNLVTSGAFNTTITVTADSNATLPAGTKTLVATDVATLSSLASVGTITTGVWNAGAVTSSSTVTATTTVKAGSVAFASLGTPAVGTVVYCSDCDTPAAGAMAVCTSAAGQAGAWAFRTSTAVPVWGCIGI